MPVALMLVSLVVPYLCNGDGSLDAHRHLAAVIRLGAHGVPTVNQRGLAACWFPKAL